VRASRLLSFVLLLQARGRLTAEELAERLEVSVRTVYRDAEALAEAGIPIEADRGPAGGYRLREGYRSKLLGLTAEEAEALMAGGRVPAADLGLGALLAAAQLKVLAALPADLRERAERAQRLFHLDAPGWFRRREETPQLAGLAAAVWDGRRVHVRYRRGSGEEIERTLDPLGLVLKAGAWYLAATGEGETRVYRVARFRTVEPLDDPIERPGDFELSEFWEARVREFEESRPSVEVEVRVRERALRSLRPFLEPDAWRGLTAATPRRGWIRATVPFERLEYAFHELAAAGADVEVLGPAELRERFVESARGLARLYAPG
jgi:predicted DNA-binding transcriptional regulator YafY